MNKNLKIFILSLMLLFLIPKSIGQDQEPPQIQFVPPTPNPGETRSEDYVYINVSITDDSSTSAFLDWDRSLVGYWAMDWYDSSGIFDNSTYNNFGTFNGGLGTSDITTGRYGYGLSFDGQDDNINCGNDSSLNPEYITVEAWVYPIAEKLLGPSDAQIVSKLDFANKQGYWLRWFNITQHVDFAIGNGTTWREADSSTNSVPLNQWTHVLGTYDGSYLRIYVNCVLEDTSSYHPGQIASTINDLRIGAESPSYKRFNGTIDEVRIWDRVLSDKEIEQRCQQYAPPDSVSYWKFDESRGITTYDSSPNGNDGVFYGESFNDGTLGDGNCDPGVLNCPTRTSNGWFGKSLDFDGENDYVEVPHGSSLSGFTEFTASFWMRQDDITRRQAILYKWGGGGPAAWFIDGPSYAEQDLGFYISETGASSNPGVDYIEWHADHNPIPGSWYHIAVVWKANEHAQFYVNGTPVTTTTPASTFSQIYDNVGAPFLIGKCPYDSNRDFNGTIDEVRIWDRVLSQSEIQAEMQSSMPVERSVASWSFEEEDSARYVNDTHIWVKGEYGAALSFDGSNDYVDVSSFNPHTYNDFTIMAWYKSSTSSVVDDQYIFLHSDGVDWVIFGPTDDIAGDKLRFEMRVGGSENHYYGTSDIVDQTWKHLVAVRNSTHINLYVNGVLENSNADLGPGTPCPVDGIGPYIGKNPGSASDQVNGIVDEVRTFNRALSPEEIKASYNSGLYRLYHNFTNLADGTYDYYAYAIDTSGNANKTGTRTVTLATGPPYCDELIDKTTIPFTIDQSNTYYCLIEDSNPDLTGTAISFNSGTQNSTLDCQGFNIDGVDSGTYYGIRLNGINTKNNTIKNCNVADFYRNIYLYDYTNNNTLINNTANSGDDGVNDSYGIALVNSNNNILINNTANYNEYGIYLYNSHNNKLTDNIAKYNNIYQGKIGIYLLAGSSNNNITGGSISENPQDYFMRTNSPTNYFTNTNFTAARTIILYDTSNNWFNYNNETTGNIWLKTTNVSAPFIKITRKLISWSQSLMQWNDSASYAVTVRYNISGLNPNTEYNIYSNSQFVQTLQTDSDGNLPSFTISLSSEHEIKVEASGTVPGAYNFTAWAEGPSLYTTGRPETVSIYVKNLGSVEDSYIITPISSSHLIDVSIPSNRIVSLEPGKVGSVFGTITLLGIIETGSVWFNVTPESYPSVYSLTAPIEIRVGYPVSLPEFELLGSIQIIILAASLFLFVKKLR